MIWQAVWTGFAYFQREAGYTRTGSHNTRVHHRETGQWREADLAVAHWLQHTSRDGDMQLHVHSQIAHVAKTTTDGKWRAPDSLGYNEHVGAVAAIVSQHLEEALTARFGLEWVARDDGHGFEIKGISGEMMRVFSTRRESITADLRARAARFEEQYGRAPSQRELAHLAQASNFKTRKAKHGTLDVAQVHAGWADKLAQTLGVSLASVAPSVWHGGGRAGTRTPGPGHTRPAAPRRDGTRGAEGRRAGPAGKEHLDPRRRDQVPGPGAALLGHGPGRSRCPARGSCRPGIAVRVRARHLPGMQLGIVTAGPAVRIADGAQASAGDLILCTRNDHTVQASEPGRTLANGDLLRIEAVTRHGLIVRRALDADPRTGQRRWTDRTFVYANYADAELGYAVTDHAAQGRTVHTGLAVITGTEDRQHAYVALSRGTDVNLAYVLTTSPKQADPAPGPRPAPELARYDQIYPERTGVRAPNTQPALPGTALAVLVGVLDRDGQQRSATQIRNQALADADHLAILHAIWTAETTPAREQRYRDLLMSILPPGDRREPSHQAKWLWRTLRGAELAGQDPGQILAAAIGERDLAGARDLAAVIDARLRYRLGSPVPLPAGSWSAQVPEIADPEGRAYVTEIAALMDARKDRIGEHAADHALPWAVAALGPVPRIRWTGWTGRNGPPPSAPGGNCPATTTPPTQSAPN
jgi:hypothetical protein